MSVVKSEADDMFACCNRTSSNVCKAGRSLKTYWQTNDRLTTLIT